MLPSSLRGIGAPALAGLLAATALLPQGFREDVAVDLVRVDLFVTDRDGAPVRGLSAAQVHVRVDGRPVAIEGLEPFGEPAQRPAATPVAAPPEAATGPSAPRRPAASPAPARPALSLAILIDETSSAQFSRNRIYAELRKFLESGLPDGVVVQFQRFDGKLRPVGPWTSDRGTLRRDLAALSRRGVVSILPSPDRLAGEPDRLVSPPVLESALHSRRALAGLRESLTRFPPVAGRKALAYVTDGAPFLSPSDMARIFGEPQREPGVRTAMWIDARAERRELDAMASPLLAETGGAVRSRWVTEMQEIGRLALRREIALIPVRSAPLEVGGFLGADGSGGDLFNPVDGSRTFRGRHLDKTFSTSLASWAVVNQQMETLAETTGGEAVLSRAALGGRLGRFSEEGNEGYVLTFRNPFPPDRRTRAIVVEVDRPKVRLRYRRGYRVSSPTETLLDTATDRLYAPREQNPLGARLKWQAIRRERGRAIARLTISYPVPPQAGGPAAGDRTVEIAALCLGEKGHRSEPIESRRTATLLVREGQTLLVTTVDLGLPTGRYFWSLAIRDVPSRLTSYLTSASRF